MTRPCRWPDGGCGAEVEFFPTGKTKPDGKPVLQVVDAEPEKRIVLEHGGRTMGSPRIPPLSGSIARVVDTYVDHHATCPKWAAKVERERAAKAARP
jgi:hypothetical protein